MTRCTVHLCVALLFLTVAVPSGRVAAQIRVLSPSFDPMTGSTGGMIISEWTPMVMVLRAPDPGDLPATDVNVRKGLRQLHEALKGMVRGRPRRTAPPAQADASATPGTETGNDVHATAVPPPSTSSGGAKTVTSGLRLTRWGPCGVTLTAADPWRSARQKPGQGSAPPARPPTPVRTPSNRNWVNPPPLTDQDVMQRWEDADAHPSEATFQALTDALFSRADWSGLLEAAQRWLAFSPRSPAARGALGIAHLSLGHHDQAVTIFQAMVSAAPDDPAIADRAGVHLLLTDRADLADPLFRQTIAAYPDDPVPVRHLALLLWQRQHPEEAVEVLEQFLRAHPDSIDVRPILLDDLALAYHAALAAGGDDWAIRQRAARLGVSLDHWRDVRVVVEWAPTHEAVELHLAHTSLANGGTTRDLDKLVPPRNEVEDMGGILSARLIPPLPGRWHVGVGTSSPTSAPVHGTVMVIAPAFRDRVALVLIQPFSLMPGASQVRHVLSFDLPGGGAPPEVAGETRIEP